MPIYEYQCEQCGQHLEIIQKISENPLHICPACQQPALKKLISAAGFRLKGGGWYETDFKSNAQKNLADKPENSSSSKPENNNSTKPEGSKSE